MGKSRIDETFNKKIPLTPLEKGENKSGIRVILPIL
jgi:hypothetical protein